MTEAGLRRPGFRSMLAPVSTAPGAALCFTSGAEAVKVDSDLRRIVH